MNAWPLYQCHKQVRALKILDIVRHDHPVKAATIFPSESPYPPFCVDQAYLDKHNPQPGGYYVQYEDGYQSFSPAKAFEDGYALIGQAAKAASLVIEGDICGGFEYAAKCHGCADAREFVIAAFGMPLDRMGFDVIMHEGGPPSAPITRLEITKR